MYTILCIKYKTDKDLQYSTRNYTQYFAISSKGKESEKNRDVCVCVCVCVCLVAKLCPILYKPMDCSPPSSSVHGFPRQEYQIRLPFSSPGHFPHPGLEPSPPALADRFFTVEPTREAQRYIWTTTISTIDRSQSLCCTPEINTTL